MSLIDLERVSSIFQNCFTVLALIIGGIWTYFHFIKGRVFRPSLELSASGDLFSDNTGKFLIVKVKLKNVGSSKLDIVQKGTGLRVKALKKTNNARKAYKISGDRLITLSIFKDHQWIEPNEHIDDVQLLSMPSDCENILLEVRLISKGLTWKSWNIVSSTKTEKEK
jgi:hypothetical protein